MKKKPYIDCEFAGVHPFIESLEKVEIHYELMDVPEKDKLYKDAGELLNRETDTVFLGKCVKDGKEMFFTDIGINITPSYNSHVVFVFDHQPSKEEILVCVQDMEKIIMQRLDSFDPSILSSADKTQQ